MRKLLFIFMLFFAACQSEEDPKPTLPPCEMENFGALLITNFKSEPFDFYVNGDFWQRLKAGEKIAKPGIKAGYCNVKAIEVEYLLSPTTYILELDLKKCENNVVELK